MADTSAFNRFKNHMLKNVIDEINHEASLRHLSVSVLDPDNGAGFNIDRDPRRLNVTVDANFYIVKFNIG